MEGGGAFGGGMAGGAFNPVTFVQRPNVLLRALCWLFSIIVFGCISSQGWRMKDGRDVCLYNENANACNYGVAIGVIGFLASMAFIVGEYLFEQMSSVKTRKHYVLGDLAFSGLWAFLFFVAFCYLWNQWGKAEEPPMGQGTSNVQSAIVFSLFSIFTWAGCAFFAFQRFKAGVDAALTAQVPTYNAQDQSYASYPAGANGTDEYQEPPFGQQQQQQQQQIMQQQQMQGQYQQPTY